MPLCGMLQHLHLYGEIYILLSLILPASASALLCSGAIAADCLSIDSGRMAKDKSYQKSVMASCLANKDKAEAQYMLGTIYYDGAGVRKNIGEAEKWISAMRRPCTTLVSPTWAASAPRRRTQRQ